MMRWVGLCCVVSAAVVLPGDSAAAARVFFLFWGFGTFDRDRCVRGLLSHEAPLSQLRSLSAPSCLSRSHPLLLLPPQLPTPISYHYLPSSCCSSILSSSALWFPFLPFLLTPSPFPSRLSSSCSLGERKTLQHTLTVRRWRPSLLPLSLFVICIFIDF